MKENARYFYLQDNHNRTVVCVASRWNKANQVDYAVCTWNPHDVYDREKARFVAVERLNLMRPHYTGTVQPIPGGNVKLAIVQEIANNRDRFCQRAWECASLWMKVWETTEGHYKLNLALEDAARALRTAAKGQPNVLRNLVKRLAIKVFSPGKKAARPVITRQASPFAHKYHPRSRRAA